MGISRGISAFLEGAIQGQQYRQDWQERKEQKAIEAEERTWAKEDRAWDREDRMRRRAAEEEDAAWTREQRGIVRSKYQKETADAAEEEKLFEDVLKEAQKAADEGIAPKLSAPGSSKKKAKPAAGRASAPASEPSAERASPAPGRAAAPAENGAAYAAGVTPVATAAPRSVAALQPGAEAVQPGRMGAPHLDPTMPPPQSVAPGTIAPVQGPPQEPMAQAVALSRPGAAPAAQQPAAVAQAPVQGGGPVQGPPPGSDPMQAAIAMSAPQSAPARAMTAAPAPSAPTAALSPLVDPSTGRSLSMPQAAARTAGPAAMAMPSMPEQASRPTARAMVPSAAPSDPTPTTPSIEIAAETSGAPQLAARSVTPGAAAAEASQGPESFIQRYREVAVPKIVEHYLGKGDLERATAFQKWADDGATADGMKAWAKGVQAAAAGDEDGFLDNMVGAYNATGYFDDGYQVVRKDSGFTRDESGTITGARLTFKNQQTGAISSRVFEDVEDIYRMGVNFLSPEAVFEYGQEQIAAAGEAQAKEAAHERQIEIEVLKARLSGKGATDYQKAISETMKTLMETDGINGEFAKLPPDQQVAKAVEIVKAQEAAARSLGQLGQLGQGRQAAPADWRG